jgi:hypothetical protein
MGIEQRIRKAEEKLSMSKEPAVCQIVMFGGGPLPPDKVHGNIIIKHVAYEDLIKEACHER